MHTPIESELAAALRRSEKRANLNCKRLQSLKRFIVNDPDTPEVVKQKARRLAYTCHQSANRKADVTGKTFCFNHVSIASNLFYYRSAATRPF